MAGENRLNFVYIINEFCFMKCNAFYEDQCSSCCFDSEGTKILNASRTARTAITTNLYYSNMILYIKKTKIVNNENKVNNDR